MDANDNGLQLLARYGQNERELALGRKAWLFAGSELAGQRAAIVMSLVQTAKLYGHDPWAYLNDVLTRLPNHLNSRMTSCFLTTGIPHAERVCALTAALDRQDGMAGHVRDSG